VRNSVITARYYNSNGFAVAIVAVITNSPAGAIDWTSYIAGTDRTWQEEQAVDDAVSRGDKLSRDDAHYYFPDLPIKLYRS